MSYNGSGTFVINSAGQPVVTGTAITSTAFNALTGDLATGLTTAITKDGQTTPTANLTLGGYKITNLANGSASTDAINYSQLQSAGYTTLITISGTDTITGTVSPTLTAYLAGAQFSFVVGTTNTGAVTLNIDALGAKAVTRTGAVALVAGDLIATQMVEVMYDGTRFQLVNGNSFTNLKLSGTLAVTGATTLATSLTGALIGTSGVVSAVAPGTSGNVLTSNGTTWTSSASSGVTSFNGSTTGLTPNTATTGAITLGGTLAVANGGSGAATLTANSILVGAGTSAITGIAAGTSGNVLTSNGTTWASTAVAASGFTNIVSYTSPGTWTLPSGITKVKVTVIGGGAGGGPNGSPGGGGGGTSIWIIPVSGPVAYTVGSGGATNGGAGGNSTFGPVGPSGTATGAGATSQTGGAGTTGQVNITGGSGSGNPSLIGGSSFMSSVGRGGNGKSTSSPTPSTGDAGSAGLLIIEY